MEKVRGTLFFVRAKARIRVSRDFPNPGLRRRDIRGGLFDTLCGTR